MNTTCDTCGAPRQPGAQFCPSCGHAFVLPESDTAATQVMPTAPPTASVPAPPAQPDPAGGVPPANDDEGRKRRNREIAAGVIAVLLVAGGVVAYLLSTSDSNYENELRDVLAPVIESNRAFNETAENTRQGGSSTPLIQAAEEAADDARRALTDSESIPGAEPQQERVVRNALRAEIDYATLVADRDNWQSERLRETGEAAEDAGARLVDLAPEFEPLVVQPVVETVERSEQRRAQRSEAREFTDSIDDILAAAAPAATDLETMAAEIEAGDISLNDARATITEVINNRAARVSSTNTLSAPDSSAADAQTQLAEYFRLALANDEDFREALGAPDVGDEAEFLRSAYDAAYANTSRVTAKQREFIKTYNAYRATAGLPPVTSETF